MKLGARTGRRRKIKDPGSQTKLGIAVTAEVDRILRAAEDLSPTHWMVCALMLETGMHPCMFDRLRLSMVKGEVIQWPRPKTSKIVSRYIQPRLRRALELYFSRNKGFTRQYAYQLVKEVGVAAEVPEISPMTFRKTFCVLRLMEGESIDQVASMMGCSVALVRDVYSALSPEQQRAITLALAHRMVDTLGLPALSSSTG